MIPHQAICTGALAGAVTYGHLLFTTDLRYIDDYFKMGYKAIHDVKAKRWEKATGTYRALSQVSEICRRATLKLDAVVDDWGNYRQGEHGGEGGVHLHTAAL